jgi:hypothetical protein
MTSNREAVGRPGPARNSGWPVWALVLLLLPLLAFGWARPALAQSPLTPLPNGGFETGDLTGWATGCFGGLGGCDNWSVSVGPEYARSGRFGARFFMADVGLWGHAMMYSSRIDDGSATYTFPIKLVGGATRFLVTTATVASAPTVTLTATVGGARQYVLLQLLPTTGS